MDDILASIRRILDEEGARAGGAPGLEPPHGADLPEADLPDEPPRDILQLDTSMMLPEPDAATPGPIPAPPAPTPSAPILAAPILAPPVMATQVPSLAEPDRPLPIASTAPAMPQAGLPGPGRASSLVAPAAAAAAASSVGALVRTLATERGTAVSRGGPTIEDLVRDEMRPLLKDWLDMHLPPLVERLVRAEIERVISRSG